MVNQPLIIPVLVGPTAVGKSAVAVKVADELDAEIISADSRQIYRGMEIGSGAPSPSELAAVPHHLIGCIEPEMRLSAGEVARLALEAIRDISSRGKTPIIVGGSGLYIRALVDGIAPIPQINPDIRQGVTKDILVHGMEAMIKELAKVDPDYAGKINLKDEKRLIRALEVWRSTGKTFSDWHNEAVNENQINAIIFGISRPRHELWSRIATRVNLMFRDGWIREVEMLIKKFGSKNALPPAVTEGLGNRVIVDHLEGKLNREEAIEKIVTSTRQFAKRQMTWFKASKRTLWKESSGESAVDEWADWIAVQYESKAN